MNQHTKQQAKKWEQALVPIYGERESQSMWRWYIEDKRDVGLFEQDLARLKTNYPIQYLLGYTWFYGRKLIVNEHTLIPRPETEELVYRILEENSNKRTLRVLDIGTGTGCIALTLAIEQPDWKITGVDVSAEALKIAQQNSEVHNTTIQWGITDILEWEKYHLLNESYELIVSNPPYIAYEEKTRMDKNVVNYEPHKALFTSDKDGLEFYEAIAACAAENLTDGGQLFLELHEGNSTAIESLFRKYHSYSDIKVTKDMQGKFRILQARKALQQ